MGHLNLIVAPGFRVGIEDNVDSEARYRNVPAVTETAGRAVLVVPGTPPPGGGSQAISANVRRGRCSERAVLVVPGTTSVL